MKAVIATNRLAAALLMLYAFACVLTIALFNGTGDSGDSVLHYLFARFAPQHPALFFDHWAKPVYVLLACPFAQFGFTGIKVFNALASLASMWLTYKIALRLELKNAVLAMVIMMVAPFYYILTFSGLTEPLFALFLAGVLYLSLRQSYVAAAVLVSFMPYVRSEGLIILGVLALFLPYKKAWRALPFLLGGSVLYGVAGYAVHHNLLWVFSKIPYARLQSHYGSGGLFHFAEQLVNLLGIPAYILFWTGLLCLGVKALRKKASAEELLVAACFVSFFVAHSLFWYLGIFNSMGLARVLVGVMPAAALVVLYGYNFVVEELARERKRLRLVLAGLLIAYLVIFPFTPNPAAVNFKKDMQLSAEQELAAQAAHVARQQKTPGARFFYAQHYLSMLLNIDHFDGDLHRELRRNSLQQLKPGDLVIWDSWFARVEGEIEKTELDAREDLEAVYSVKGLSRGKEVVYAVYRKK